MESSKLEASAQTHFNDPETRGEWALSVATLPSASHEEIVVAADWIKQRVYRFGTVGTLVQAGFPVLADDPPHAVLMLLTEPTEEMWAALRLLLPNQFNNPLFEERRLRNG